MHDSRSDLSFVFYRFKSELNFDRVVDFPGVFIQVSVLKMKIMESHGMKLSGDRIRISSLSKEEYQDYQLVASGSRVVVARLPREESGDSGVLETAKLLEQLRIMASLGHRSVPAVERPKSSPAQAETKSSFNEWINWLRAHSGKYQAGVREGETIRKHGCEANTPCTVAATTPTRHGSDTGDAGGADSVHDISLNSENFDEEPCQRTTLDVPLISNAESSDNSFAEQNQRLVAGTGGTDQLNIQAPSITETTFKIGPALPLNFSEVGTEGVSTNPQPESSGVHYPSRDPRVLELEQMLRRICFPPSKPFVGPPPGFGAFQEMQSKQDGIPFQKPPYGGIPGFNPKLGPVPLPYPQFVGYPNAFLATQVISYDKQNAAFPPSQGPAGPSKHQVDPTTPLPHDLRCVPGRDENHRIQNMMRLSCSQYSRDYFGDNNQNPEKRYNTATFYKSGDRGQTAESKSTAHKHLNVVRGGDEVGSQECTATYNEFTGTVTLHGSMVITESDLEESSESELSSLSDIEEEGEEEEEEQDKDLQQV